ncbi:endolytic transglycosylase MltG [bacterium]|nr:endolytic transglycosylase MltG [bacterium]
MLRRLLLVVLAGMAVGLAVLAWGWSRWTGPGPGAGGTPVVVRIPPGMTLGAAADTLVARGLLADRRVLLAGARLTGRDRGLRAGLYELSPGQAPRDLLADLTAGRSIQVAVTIPEGLDAGEIGAIVASAFGWQADAFLAAADSLARLATETGGWLGPDQAARLDSLTAATAAAGPRRFRWCEGLLAPDTYRFATGTGPDVVAAHLVDTQAARLGQAVEAARGGVNAALTPFELLTLASIVEAEARRDDERRLIAAVYTNRMQRGWRLEADPTVAFLLDRKGQRLYFKHLKTDSPYNTYRRRGLPPGPIGTPGVASLAAAATPDTSCEALYFVSDGADGHVFSRTAREHEDAVRRFRALRSGDRAAD